tara:strand:+ start:231 stop:989 length:759 start_codon:yes stop_codon:yes gene_type:complete
MADRIIKSDSGNDTVIQNNSGSRKIEVTNSGDVEVTGDVKTTTVKATNLKANDGTAGLSIADSTGEVTSSGGLKATTVKATNLKANDGTAGLVVADSTGNVTRSKKIAFKLTAGGSQTVATDVWPPTKVTGTVDFEYNLGSTDIASSVFTVPVAGVYLIGGLLHADFGSSGPLDLNDHRVFISYTPSGGSISYINLVGGFRTNAGDDAIYLNGSNILNLSANDTIAMSYYFSESGKTSTIKTNTNFFGYLLF